MKNPKENSLNNIIVNKPRKNNNLSEDDDPPKEIDLNTNATISSFSPILGKIYKNDDENKLIYDIKKELTIDKEKFQKVFDFIKDPNNSKNNKSIKSYLPKRNKKSHIKTIDKENKTISFETRNKGELKCFRVFNDELVFKGVNPAYLQDVYEDTGMDSDEEKINYGEKYLFQDLEKTTNTFLEILEGDKDFSDQMNREFQFEEDEEEEEKKGQSNNEK